MYFALGLLTAGLLALVIMPAIWRRAVRLTRARVEAAMPMTLAEIEADKDQLRANFAVANRRLEMEVGTLKEKLAESTIQIGRGRDEVSALARARSALSNTVAALEEQTAELAGALSTAENKLATANAEIAARDARLTEQDAALADLRVRFEASQVMTEELRLELVARATEIGNLADSVAAMKASDAASAAARDRLSSELALERDRLVAEQKRADGLAAGLAALQAERTGRIADLDRAAADLKARDAALAAEYARREQLAAAAEAMKAERADAMAEGDNFRKAMAATEAEKEGLLGRIAALEEQHAALSAENAELRRVAGAEWESEREENRQLRERLKEIADGVVRLAQSQSEPAAPSLVTEVPARTPAAEAEPEEDTAAADLRHAVEAAGTRH
jgi:chromosome segregation ATPase